MYAIENVLLLFFYYKNAPKCIIKQLVVGVKYIEWRNVTLASDPSPSLSSLYSPAQVILLL